MGFAGPIMAQSHEEIEGHTSFFTFDNINDGPLLFTEVQILGKRYTVRHHLSWEYLISSGKYWNRNFEHAGIKNDVIAGLAAASMPNEVK